MRNTPRKGTCYRDALRLLELLGGNDWLLCHGVAVNTGKAFKGRKFGHAWIENDQWCLDQGLVIRKSTYYMVGKIRPVDVVRFSKDQACYQLLKTGNYGPWNNAIIKAEAWIKGALAR